MFAPSPRHLRSIEFIPFKTWILIIQQIKATKPRSPRFSWCNNQQIYVLHLFYPQLVWNVKIRKIVILKYIYHIYLNSLYWYSIKVQFNDGWTSFVFWLGYTNSSINPFIYAVKFKEFRPAFRDSLSWLMCRSSDRRRLEAPRWTSTNTNINFKVG